MELKSFKNIIKRVLDELYDEDEDLFEFNLWERCIVFRFAYRLQERLKRRTLFVDCEYNRSFSPDDNGNYTRIWTKNICKENWEFVGRTIDIVVRSERLPTKDNSDIICIECKKRNSSNKEWFEKDDNNLRELTGTEETQYWYKWGFLLTFWKERWKCKCNVYSNGELTEENTEI